MARPADKDHWRGTATQLLNCLTEGDRTEQSVSRWRSWPRDLSAFGVRLRDAAATLRKSASQPGSGETRIIELRKLTPSRDRTPWTPWTSIVRRTWSFSRKSEAGRDRPSPGRWTDEALHHVGTDAGRVPVSHSEVQRKNERDGCRGRIGGRNGDRVADRGFARTRQRQFMQSRSKDGRGDQLSPARLGRSETRTAARTPQSHKAGQSVASSFSSIRQGLKPNVSQEGAVPASNDYDANFEFGVL
jgi:curved DNA-binding protein CbpA